MVPTFEQIRTAAYHRWEHRGYDHGRDYEDWSAAEQDLSFTLNYEPYVFHWLDESSPTEIGRSRPRVCRFCEMDDRRTTFEGVALAVPEAFGNRSLRTLELCDECRQNFDDGILADLQAFARPFLAGPRPNPRGRIGVGAYKGLAQVALAAMPREFLDDYVDAIEWVNNPDHEADLRAFDGLGCCVHAVDRGASPFFALARRVEHDTPYPFLLAFLGLPGGVVLQAPVPLSTRDEDHEESTFPRVASPLGAIESSSLFLPLEADALAAGGGRGPR